MYRKSEVDARCSQLGCRGEQHVMPKLRVRKDVSIPAFCLRGIHTLIGKLDELVEIEFFRVHRYTRAERDVGMLPNGFADTFDQILRG